MTESPLTLEQLQRVEVLPIARKALESTKGGGSVFTAPTREAPMVTELLEVADWLLTGVRLVEHDELPEHVAVHNVGAGLYLEVDRGAPGEGLTQRTTTFETGTDLPDLSTTWVHAKELDDTRLCGASGFGSVFWGIVTCPECLAIIATREVPPEHRAEPNVEEPQTVPGQRAGEQVPVAPPELVHYYVNGATTVACGMPEAGVANWVNLDEQEQVTCEACIIKLHEHGHRKG